MESSDHDHSDDAAGEALSVSATLKPKIWRVKVVQEYIDNILIRTCLEIVEGGETWKVHEILFQVFERFHARVENQSAHRRPDELCHPQKLLECTAFKTQKEWDAWKVSTKHGTGKSSVTNPDAGALSEAHFDWASKKWDKYKVIKREIHDSVQRLWIELVPNNVLPSGATRINDLVEKLRKGMFDVWKFAKTHNKSKIKYADQDMVGPCQDWHPNWWNCWKSMGPASGRCSATFMSEVGMKISTVPAALPGLFEEHFEGIASGGCANFALHPKRAIKDEFKRADSTPATPVTQMSQARARSLDTKAALDIRKHEIQRLEFLIKSEHASPAEKQAFAKELFTFMRKPVVESPDSLNSSLSAGQSSNVAIAADAASISIHKPSSSFVVEPQRLLPLLLQMPTASTLDSMVPQSDTLTEIDCDQIEEDAMRGDHFTFPSCPVDIEAADFANSMLSIVSKDYDQGSPAKHPLQRLLETALGVFDPTDPAAVAAAEAAQAASLALSAASVAKGPALLRTSAVQVAARKNKSPAVYSIQGGPSLLGPSAVQVAARPAVASPKKQIMPSRQEIAARQRLMHQKKFVSYVSTCFRVVDPQHDGNCLFNCFVMSFARNNFNFTGLQNSESNAFIPWTAEILRHMLADELIRLDGVIPGQLYNPFDEDFIDVERRGGNPSFFTVATYANALRTGTSMYGGDIELALVAWLFKIKIFLLSSLQWRGADDKLCPMIHVAPEEFEDPEGGEICLLWTEGFTGGSDHYQLLIPKRASADEFRISSSDDEGPGSMSSPPKALVFPYPDPAHDQITTAFSKHALMMGNGLPKWNVDLKVCVISPEIGRGIVALRTFEEKEVVGIYDGHRCDVDGNIIIERAGLRLLFKAYPQLDRRVTGDKFKLSHTLCCGRNHESGLVIDGFPLCDPILDANVDSLGRFALANSASSDVTANVAIEWLTAPDLPPDVVNKCSDKECFVVCTRRIEVGDELLWNYQFQAHMSPSRKQFKRVVKSPKNRFKPIAKPKTKLKPSELDPDCLCPGDTKCLLGKCWFYGGRVLPRRRH